MVTKLAITVSMTGLLWNASAVDAVTASRVGGSHSEIVYQASPFEKPWRAKNRPPQNAQESYLRAKNRPPKMAQESY